MLPDNSDQTLHCRNFKLESLNSLGKKKKPTKKKNKKTNRTKNPLQQHLTLYSSLFFKTRNSISSTEVKKCTEYHNKY